MEKMNCWTYMQCDREPGGKNVPERGVCAAASHPWPDGINGGINGGRTCWLVRNTQCMEALAEKSSGRQVECGNCEFRLLVEKEKNAGMSGDEMAVDFNGIPIRAHARVLIQTLEDVGKRRYCGRYVRAMRDVSVLIVTPDDLWLHENQQLIIWVFSERYAYAFYSRLLHSHCRSSPYFRLAYPASMMAKRVRTSQRVRAGILGQIRLDAGGDNPIPVVVWDIGTSGALVEPEQCLGTVGDTVSLHFTLRFEEVVSEMRIKGRIRNARDVVVGVEFDEMDAADRLLLHYFVDYRLAE